MKENKMVTIKELQEMIDLSESGVKKVIRQMRQTGIIEHIGGNKGGHWEVLEQ